jgi:hypothetical protein
VEDSVGRGKVSSRTVMPEEEEVCLSFCTGVEHSLFVTKKRKRHEAGEYSIKRSSIFCTRN